MEGETDTPGRIGGGFGNFASEFKKLPTGGKIAVLVIALVVVGIAIYEFKKNATPSSGIGSASPSTDTTGGSATSGLPNLPYGTTALSDAAGNAIGFVNPPPTPTTPPPTSGSGHIPVDPPVVQHPMPTKMPTSRVGVTPALSKYTVQSGNSLWGISQKLYGNGNQWQTIYNANRNTIGSNPNLIKSGQVLVIPKKP